MSIVDFDPAGSLHLNFRRGVSGEKLFTFLNTDTTPYSLVGIDFELRIKKRAGLSTNVLLLGIGEGLEIDINELTVSVTAEQMELPADFYWYELFNVTTDEVWLYGNVYVNEGSEEPESEVEVTINLDPDTVVVTIQSTGASSAVSPFRGSFDPTGVLLPSSGGSGAGGSIQAGDEWIFSVGETFGGLFYPADTIVKAKIDTPTQSLNDWRLI
jgi:hypothetical protein